ncbi:MAG TPA: succinate dehydrogenase cytochrome b subunit [Kofleriaceae bacterium]|nr:succinate dehydrogenase cytochrome b subunit [Kofleriaceae bacterium]
MTWLARYLRSSIGVKQAMAVTGLALVVFAIFHMLGHLQMFGGREVYNAYAHFLQELWEVKWPTRVALLAFLLVHLVAGIAVTLKNRAARPTHYAIFRPVVTSAAARTMIWTGAFVFAFLAFHILHFTVGAVQPAHFHVMDPLKRWDAFGMYVAGFRDARIYAIYFVGMALLSLHLGHGASSWLQTLGWRHPKYRVDKLGAIVGWTLFVGYMLPPTAVLAGMIG